MKTFERKKRELDVVTDKTKWNQVISKFLLKKEMSIKGHSGMETVWLREVNPAGNGILVKGNENSGFAKGQKVILFKILARYIQLDCTVKEAKSDFNYILTVDDIKIAKKDRGEERIMAPVDLVWATNIKTSKTTIDANLFNIPASVKVNFTDYENRLRASCDYIKIDTFRSMDDKFGIVKKTQKTLYVEDTSNPESYKAMNDDFVDYAEELDDELQRTMNEYRDQKVVSEIIVPVIYINPAEEAIPIGYVHMQSKSDKFDFEKVIQVKTLTFEMMDRIRESNLVINTNRFQVMDISSNGLKLKIDDPDLSEQLSKYPGFSFDIFFKMQSPLTAYGIIRSISRDADNNIYLGILIDGHTSRPGERERYLENVKWLRKQVLGDK